MKMDSWKSRFFALALICSLIVSSAGVVLGDETEEIWPDSAAEEMIVMPEDDSLDLFASPEPAGTIDANADSPTVIEEDTAVTDETVIEEEFEEEEDIIDEEPETDLEMLFESARADLDQVLTVKTDTFIRIRTVYTCVSLSFPEVQLTDEEMALLTQRLLENYSLRSCVLSGWNEIGEQVFWNLVQVDEVFFNLDVSLDRGVEDQQQWKGFLKGGAAPFGYVRDEAYTAVEFNTTYPVSEDDYIAVQEQVGQPDGSEAVYEETIDEAGVVSEKEDGRSEVISEEIYTESEAVSEEDNIAIQEEAGQSDGSETAYEKTIDEAEMVSEKENGKSEVISEEMHTDSEAGSEEDKKEVKKEETPDEERKEKREVLEEDEDIEEVSEAEAYESLTSGTTGQSVWFGRYVQNKVAVDSDSHLLLYYDEWRYVDDAFYKNFDRYFPKLETVNGIKYLEDEYFQYWRFDPIEWIVLEKSGDYYKLLSKEILEEKHFFDGWQNSEIRSWLNSADGFIGGAFNKNEQTDMAAREIYTHDGGNKQTTKDKVAFLDKSELVQVSVSSRKAYASKYISATLMDDHYTDVVDNVMCTWWLRGDTTYDGIGNTLQSYIDENGKVDTAPAGVRMGIRPVIWVKASSPYLYTSHSAAMNALMKGIYADNITLNLTQKTMNIGETTTLNTTLSPSTAIDKTVTWSSSNTKVVTVDSNGKVKAVAQGSATITAKTANGKTATCKITVSQYKVITKITLNKTTLTLNEGASQTLKVTPTPATGVNTAWTWSSSNTKVVTVDSAGKVKAVGKGTATITVKSNNGKQATCKVTVKGISVQYRTYVQTNGWQGYVSDGAMSGTEGQAKRLEGINIRLVNKGYSGDILFRTYVQSYGWQAWKKNGEMAGTSGEAKRFEAIQIKLNGDLAKNYDIYYCTYIQTFGWSGWAKNGAMCGSTGYAKRLEGIKIVMVKKGGKAPGRTEDTFYKKNSKIKVNLKNPSITYTYANIGKTYYLSKAAGITTDPSRAWTSLSFSSSNKKVVQIVNSTDIKIMGTGDADIKVTAKALSRLPGYGSGTATIHVKVLAKQKITISGLGAYDSTNRRYNVTYTNQLKNIKASALGGASLRYTITDNTGKTVSSDIATIDKNGNLKFSGKAVGKLFVTVKAAKKALTKGGYAAASKTFKVNVKKATPVITCSTSFTKYMEDGSFDLGAKITLGGAMKYSSSNTSKLKVDGKGVVTPVKWTGLPKQKETKITITSTATPALNAAKTVTVKVVLKNKQIEQDTEKPKISNVKVSDISAGGYTVTCDVSDNVGIQKVAFPTWTLNDGKDDLDSDWKNTALGTISDGEVTYRVKTSDHSKQVGCQYRTQIYAYDYTGNSISVSVPDVDVPIPITNVQVTDISKAGYTISCTIDKEWDVSFVKFATHTQKNGMDDLVWNVGTISGNIASYTVRTSDHNNETNTNYLTDIYAYDSSGRSASYGYPPIYIEDVQISLNETNLTLGRFDTEQLTATFNPSDVPNQEVTWRSSNPEVATVSDNGYVKAAEHAFGTTVISATNSSGKATANCTVTVRGVDITPYEATLHVGETLTLTAFSYPSDLVRPASDWHWIIYDGASFVSIEGNGEYCKVTAKEAGEAMIRVNAYSDSEEMTYWGWCTVTVE